MCRDLLHRVVRNGTLLDGVYQARGGVTNLHGAFLLLSSSGLVLGSTGGSFSPKCVCMLYPSLMNSNTASVRTSFL